jgi:hypothetical protein
MLGSELDFVWAFRVLGFSTSLTCEGGLMAAAVGATCNATLIWCNRRRSSRRCAHLFNLELPTR